MKQSVFDRIRAHYKTVKERSGKSTEFRPKWFDTGKTWLRFLPGPEDQKMFPYFPMGKHYIAGKGYIYCPTKCTAHLPEPFPCPICEFVDDLFKAGGEENRKLAFEIRSKERFAWNAVIRKTVDAEGKVFKPERLETAVMELPKEAWDGVVSLYFLESEKGLDEEFDEDEIFDFTDVKNGRDVIIEKYMDGRWKYKAQAVANNSLLSKDEEEIERLLEDRVNLEEKIPELLKSYEELAETLSGPEAEAPDEAIEAEAEEEVIDADVPFDADEETEEEKEEDDPEPEPEPEKPKRGRPIKDASKPVNSKLADMIRQQMAKRGK